MFNPRQWLLIIAIPLFLLNLAAASTESAKIEAFIQQGLPNASVGVVVLEADSGKVLFERHAKEPFPPASTTKLFTAAASLLALGADYKFQTAVLQDKSSGNVYIKFSGDPSLTIDDLKKLIADIKTAGISQINGDIIIDNTRFQSPDYAMGWTQDSTAWYHAAPITTIILNENKVPITLTSNKTLGEKTEVVLASNEEPVIKLHSDVATATQAESETNCQIEVQMNESNQLNLKGCWPQLAEPITLNVALKNPLLLAERIIVDTLRSEHIIFTGKIVLGKVSKDLTTIASHDSKPLKELLVQVLQDSNNLYSECLIKTLGAERYQRGTFHAGILAVKESLSKPTGIDFSKLRLMDGSGASEYNLVQPSQLGRLLFAMAHDKKVGEDFKDALPISGGEYKGSTIYKRFKFTDTVGLIRAKTGTKTGISALAGYLTTTQNKKLIFVIMVNHFVEGTEKIKPFEDEFCRLLIDTNTQGQM